MLTRRYPKQCVKVDQLSKNQAQDYMFHHMFLIHVELWFSSIFFFLQMDTSPHCCDDLQHNLKL